MTRQAQKGDIVKVHYTGRLDDGTVFDSSDDSEPLEFTIGEGQVISGFEETVVGMEAGQSKTATVPPEKAYGERTNDRIVTIDKNTFPEEIDPEVGQRLQVKQPDGRTIPVVVARVDEDEVTLDANHPLAGRELTFEIEVVDVEEPS